jgi:hypothetical protein
MLAYCCGHYGSNLSESGLYEFMRKDIEMSAGMPATGLAGALYLLLIIWMLLRQLVSAARGVSSEASQWQFTSKMVVMAITMVAVAIGEMMLINDARTLAISNIPALATVLKPPSNSFMVAMAAMPFALLLLIMGFLQVLRLAVGERPPEGLRLLARESDTGSQQLNARSGDWRGTDQEAHSLTLVATRPLRECALHNV